MFSSSLISVLLVVLTSLTLWLLFIPPRRLHHSSNSVPILSSPFPGLGGIGFYGNRYLWLTKTHQVKERGGIAKFNILGKVVYTIRTSDENEIKKFVSCRDLSFSQGNNFLFAGIQGAKQKGLNEDGEMDKEERKEMAMLAQAIGPRRLVKMPPILIPDALSSFEEWSLDEPIDLHKTYYPLLFKFTVRLLGPAEYARPEPQRRHQLERLMHAFWATQNNSGFFTTHLPWLPLPGIVRRIAGAGRLWWMVRGTVKKRMENKVEEDDYMQELVDKGLSVGQVSRFVIGGVIAGILNTIGTGAYTIAFLGASSSLRQRARSEIQKQLSISCRNAGHLDPSSSSTNIPILQQLESITLEEWENPNIFQTVHLCFKEVVRILLTNSLNRYYPGPSIKNPKSGERNSRLEILGHEIEDDVYVTLEPSSVSHDPKLYPSPLTFDPFRYLTPAAGSSSSSSSSPASQGKENELNFLSWGAGHHHCTGMRFATLETVVAIVCLLCWSEDFWTEVDGERIRDGRTEDVPLSNLSQTHWRAPSGGRKMRVRIVKGRS